VKEAVCSGNIVYMKTEKLHLWKQFQEWEKGDKRRMMERVNSSMIHCKNACEYHNVFHYINDKKNK
jgi:hypothetical protein